MAAERINQPMISGVDLPRKMDVGEIARKGTEALLQSNSPELLALIKDAAHSANTAPPEGQRGAPQLPPPTIEFDADSMALLLGHLQGKLNDLQMQTAMTGIKSNRAKLDVQHKENQQKIQEAIQKQQQAEAEQAQGWWARLFKTIFSALAALVAVAVSAVLFAASCVAGGAGAVLTGIALALAVAMLYDSIVDTVNFVRTSQGKEPWEGSLGHLCCKLGEKICLACGMSEERAKFWGSIIGMAMMVVVMIAGMVCGGTGATRAFSTLGKLGETVAAFAKMARDARILGFATESAYSAAGAGAGIGTGVHNLNTAGYLHEADHLRADADAIKKFITELQAHIQEQQDEIKKLMEEFDEANSMIVNMLAGNAQTRQNIIFNIA